MRSEREKTKIEVHRRKRELLNAFRDFARNGDEEGFKIYLNQRLRGNDCVHSLFGIFFAPQIRAGGLT